MFTEEQKKKYIELKSIKRINEYKQITAYEQSSGKNLNKSYTSLREFYADIVGIDANCIKQLENDTKNERSKIDKLFKNQFTKDRQEGFGTFEEFYNWYKEQNDTCYYCHTTHDTLNKLFSNNKIKSAKFGATLHIEQLDPKKGYNKENCKLACALCNNAKSDLISKENYKNYFAKAMENFLSDLSSSKIENNTY